MLLVVFGYSHLATVPYVYSCVFGISHPCPGIEAGTYHTVFRNHSSYLILGGLGGRCYWFCFFQTTKKGEGSEIPRYTKAEEEEIIHSRLDEPILPTLTFGQMFAKRISSTVTVLPEHVYSKWHYHRIITIGDSAHKVSKQICDLQLRALTFNLSSNR